MAELPETIRTELEMHLDEIRRMFAHSDDDPVCVTLVIRSPKMPNNRDIVLTNDDLNQVSGTLLRDEHLH
jgi:hypothetical protein